MTVGYVGLGAMGRALAGHLIESCDLIVWDINPEAVADFVSRGARAAESLSDLATQSDVVVLCLPKSANVEQALFGSGGLTANLAPGAVVVDQTSGDPKLTREFAARLADLGVEMIDAPVAGGVPSAISGEITIMASGSRSAFARVEGTLRCISSKVHFCSEQVGHGQAVKAINNLANAASRFFTLELLAVGRKIGLETMQVADALNAGEASSFISRRLLPAVAQAKSSTDFALSLMVKDLNLAADLAKAAKVAMPISDAARGLMTLTYNALGDDSRLDDVVSFMEKATRTKFAGPSRMGEPAVELDQQTAIRMIVDAAIAGNRAIIAEATLLARESGLSIAGFASVINSGSASSGQAELLFAMLLNDDTPEIGLLGEMLERITALTDIGADFAQALILANQVRAKYLGWIGCFGAQAGMREVMGVSPCGNG